MGPSPFEVGRAIGNQSSRGIREARDQNAIQDILSQASTSQDPMQMQNAIGKILSQVSPEKQGMALQYIQNQYQMMQQKEQEQKKRQSIIDAGIDPFLPETLQKEQYKGNVYQKSIDQILGGQPNVGNPNNVPSTNAPNSYPGDSSGRNLRGLSDDQLIAISGIPGPLQESSKQELKRRQKSHTEDRADIRENRKELAPYVKSIIDRAELSRESIRNKNHLIELIDRGNLNDPTYATFLEALPGNIGKRFLSEDTVEYKGALVDEFSDLKNIFKGATRVKEVEIYENKLADIYLTDSQKKAILKSRINMAKADLILEEAATKVLSKNPNISPLQFNKTVNKESKKKMDKLFNTVWGDQKAIIDQAESRKQIPLDKTDPEDYKIMQAIKAEAGGDPIKAFELAQKKGYRFK